MPSCCMCVWVSKRGRNRWESTTTSHGIWERGRMKNCWKKIIKNRAHPRKYPVKLGYNFPPSPCLCSLCTCTLHTHTHIHNYVALSIRRVGSNETNQPTNPRAPIYSKKWNTQKSKRGKNVVAHETRPIVRKWKSRRRRRWCLCLFIHNVFLIPCMIVVYLCIVLLHCYP